MWKEIWILTPGVLQVVAVFWWVWFMLRADKARSKQINQVLDDSLTVIAQGVHDAAMMQHERLVEIERRLGI